MCRSEKRPTFAPAKAAGAVLAKEISKWLFDERRGLIRIDMSEYGEKHNVARLIGSSPGYVGYGEGGQLTEAVPRPPQRMPDAKRRRSRTKARIGNAARPDIKTTAPEDCATKRSRSGANRDIYR